MYFIRKKETLLVVFPDAVVLGNGARSLILSFDFTVLGFQFPTQLDILSWKTKFTLNRTVKM